MVLTINRKTQQNLHSYWWTHIWGKWYSQLIGKTQQNLHSYWWTHYWGKWYSQLIGKTQQNLHCYWWTHIWGKWYSQLIGKTQQNLHSYWWTHIWGKWYSQLIGKLNRTFTATDELTVKVLASFPDELLSLASSNTYLNMSSSVTVKVLSSFPDKLLISFWVDRVSTSTCQSKTIFVSISVLFAKWKTNSYCNIQHYNVDIWMNKIKIYQT